MAQLAACVGAVGVVLALVPPRREAVLAGLVLIAVAIALLQGSESTVTAGRAALGVFGLVLLAVAATVFVRWPALVTPAALLAAPFRLPLDFGAAHRFYVGLARGGQVGRLLPLLLVVGAAGLALAWRLVRGEQPKAVTRAIAIPTSAFVAFASISLLWSGSEAAAASLLEYFMLPFVVLVAVVARAPFPSWLPRALAVIAIGLGVLFAAVGLVEEASHRLLFYSPSVVIGNTYSSFFRVTSLFRDPSIYGLHLVLGITVVLVLAWYRKIGPWLACALVAVMFAGLYFSYSQSSMAALFATALFVAFLAGKRPVRIAAAAVTAVVLASGTAVAAAKLRTLSTRRVTSDRSQRVELAARVFGHHPIAGVGLADQPHASKALATGGGPPTLFVSHTTPLTVAAELGVIGLALYVFFLAGAARALERVRRLDPALGLTLAAAFVALIVHSLFYSGFFEDPLTWFVVAVTSSFLAARARPPALS